MQTGNVLVIFLFSCFYSNIEAKLSVGFLFFIACVILQILFELTRKILVWYYYKSRKIKKITNTFPVCIMYIILYIYKKKKTLPRTFVKLSNWGTCNISRDYIR